LAAAGENCIKIYNMSTWKEIKNERIDLPPAVGRVSRLSFSSNGQILIVSTSNGFLLGFLTSIPTLTAVCGSLLALQTSFTEVMVTETSKQQLINITNIQLETEPSFISLS
jgi:WD repeat-containing protein 19